MTELLERIDKYHNNQLSEIEKLLFEYEMEKDPTIKNLYHNSLLVESMLIDFKADEFGKQAFAYSKSKETQKKYFIIISGFLVFTVLIAVYFFPNKKEHPTSKPNVETKVSTKQNSTSTSVKNEIKMYEKTKSKNVIINAQKEYIKIETMPSNQVKSAEPEKKLAIPVKDQITDKQIIDYSIPAEKTKIDICNETKISFVKQVSESCAGQEDGKISIDNAMGGKAPYSFSINNQEYKTNNKFENLASGNYIINVKDENGCTSSSMVQVKAKPCVKSNSFAIDPIIGEKVSFEATKMDCEISIYNKVGMNVFRSKIDKNNPVEWQGNSNSGEQLSDGVYLYIIECGTETLEKGYVSISKSH